MNNANFNLEAVVIIAFLILLFPKNISSIQLDKDSQSCESPFLTQTHSSVNSSTLSSRSKTLNILTYNVYMLPYFHLLHRSPYRGELLGKLLKDTDYHIIVFQEVFHWPSRLKLKRWISENFPYIYGPYDEPVNSIFTSSGVMVASKIRLKLVKKIFLKNLQCFDKLARKSAYLFEGNVADYSFYLIATHLQSNDYKESRKQQIKQIYQELIAPFDNQEKPFIIAGDLNVDSDNITEYTDMINILQAHDNQSQLEGKVTYDEIRNGLARTTKAKCRNLDYILVHSAINPDSYVRRRVVVFKNPEDKNYEDLSDHYALEAKINWELFNRKPEEIKTRDNKQNTYNNFY
ncbi:MAG: hypothetical protein GX453_08980 [Lactococcus chungangensis]|uniref:Endonuclease/exonuclease/phosphatase domain-containing protein n=1 Tax=Pseudolactococcus chungangensis TaxID=451457 RepID=A0A847J456_9LACT|nr:hypothetical protein [Lactococcus chungangensis]